MDTRAVSEQLGVLVLVGLVLTVTAGLGLGVLVSDLEPPDPSDADIQFEQIGGSLTITYSASYEHLAGDVRVIGPEGNVTWAELSTVLNPDAPIPGGNRISVGKNGPYGAEIQETDRFKVVYTENGEEYTLGGWSGGDGGEIDIPNSV